MPSVSPATSPPLPRASPVPSAQATLDSRILWPTLGPYYPKAGPSGVLAIALAYFSLGVAVGGLMKQSPRARRWLPIASTVITRVSRQGAWSSIRRP